MLREIQGTDNKSFSPILGVNKVGWSLAGVLPFSSYVLQTLAGFQRPFKNIGTPSTKKQEIFYYLTFKRHCTFCIVKYSQ